MRDQFRLLQDVLERMLSDEHLEGAVETAACEIVATSKVHGIVYAYGNGGSASQADHFIGELLGHFGSDRRPAIRAHTLSSEIAAMTAVANDDGYARYPARVLNCTRAVDCCFLFSTSCSDHTGHGSSVVEALRVLCSDKKSEDEQRARAILITGEKYRRSSAYNLERSVHSRPLVLVVPSEDTCIVQEATLVLIHEIMRRVEAKL